ncbi:hypothetical protein [Massilia glaciei]|uniref:Carboxypeptidase regulatory-like domain-containing protein n=1 Tax=Massilia glaciei TaxID=1524097 RepID=A0A2U2I541_9BURK|nr:hypothetical protein [Massilia glaciei]PWF54725.1 hypothetical protein C7C56_005610 [Massilia glaciei]
MKLFSVNIISVLTLALASLSAAAAPGSPIGGIIVKGGKNPGGQMLVLATTDASGKFSIKFAESGEYQLAFVGAARRTAGGRDADLQLDYMVRANQTSGARGMAPTARQSARFAGNAHTAQLFVKVPPGGAEIAGVLRVGAAPDASPAAERAINESGVSVKSPTKKGATTKH